MQLCSDFNVGRLVSKVVEQLIEGCQLANKRALLKRVQPVQFEEIVATTSLNRPGADRDRKSVV